MTHPYDSAVERIKQSNDVFEARSWLQAAGADYGVIHEMTHEQSVDAVEECFRRGAVEVEVLGKSLSNHSRASADMLLITLPEEKRFRKLLFELEETIASMSGYQLSVDEGQQFVLLLWT